MALFSWTLQLKPTGLGSPFSKQGWTWGSARWGRRGIQRSRKRGGPVSIFMFSSIPHGHMHMGEVGKRGGRHSPDSLEGKNSSSLKESWQSLREGRGWGCQHVPCPLQVGTFSGGAGSSSLACTAGRKGGYTPNFQQTKPTHSPPKPTGTTTTKAQSHLFS